MILHSPARRKHLTVRKHLEKLLDTHVSLRAMGQVHGEKCLCVFPRNDYEPDVVFFGPEKAAGLADDTMKFPTRDFVAEVLSESKDERDWGVKLRIMRPTAWPNTGLLTPCGSRRVIPPRGDRLYRAKSGPAKS